MAYAFALAIFSGKIIFYCKSEKSADFSDLLFHGEGRKGKIHLLPGTPHSGENESQKRPQAFLAFKL